MLAKRSQNRSAGAERVQVLGGPEEDHPLGRGDAAFARTFAFERACAEDLELVAGRIVALAERRPSDVAGLAQIPGIGATKRDRYGEQVLAVLSGADPAAVVAAAGPVAAEAP